MILQTNFKMKNQKMKKLKYGFTIVILTSIAVRAQVAIGKTSVVNSSIILDFDNSDSNKKGLILSAVENVNNALSTVSTAHNNGTFLFDKSDNKLKMYENNSWISLSDMTGNSSSIMANTSAEISSNSGVIIGSDTSAAKGVLVLESADKAMVLPWIQNPHINVKNPYPGMMCYDTSSRSLAVYDGSVWNYWK